MLEPLLLVLLADGMNGSFATPMKQVRGWEWENTWLVWSFLGMVVIPVAVAAITIPKLGSVYTTAGPGPLVRTALYGMVWGAGAVLFGLGVTRIGIALGFGIILGTASSFGAIVPFVRVHRDQLFTSTGLLTLMGVGVILAGVAACARAGILREGRVARKPGQGTFIAGLFICVLSGFGSTIMSLALNEAVPIYGTAESFGALPSRSLNAVWPVLLGGGFVVNAAYCGFRVLRRQGMARFRISTMANLGLVLLMAVLWSGSNFFYGAGARGMGPLGLVLGWPVFMAAIVLTANIWGLSSGEWRGSSGRTAAWAMVGNVLLITGIWVIASAGRTS